jgi:hypothetical protein
MSTLKSSAEDLTLNADGSGNDVIIQSNASTKVTVDGSAGDVKVESGDLFFATAGKGIVLGATSNTDANTLEDYEEGTWTPGFAGSGGGTGTLTSYGAWYTKVGRLVYVYCYIVCTGLGDMSGDVRISGLPFTVNATGGYNPVIVGSAEGLAITAGTSLTGHTRVSDTYIKLQHWDLTTGLSYLDKDELTADGGGVFTATYMA